MPGIVSKNFRIHNAEQFVENFSESNQAAYLFIARNAPWPNESVPPTPVDSTEDVNLVIWDYIMAMKRINAGDVSLGSLRYNWAQGSTYAQYTSDTAYHNAPFYVITDEYNIYKCLYNNKGAASVVKPTGTNTTPITTIDGYIWKFMGQLSPSDVLKFLTINHFPVKTLAADDGSSQWAVQQAAANNSIDVVTVTNGGTGYLTISGTAQAGSTSTVTLAGSASATNSIYVGYAVYIATGTGAGQVRRIVTYNGSNKIAGVSPNFSVAPDATSTYIVSPRVVVSGSGAGFSAYSVVNTGAVDKIVVLTPGANYRYATASISANAGSGAIVKAQIAPARGHGADPLYELFAHNVILNTKFTGSESNTFTTQNEYRTLGILLNPVLSSNGAIATNTNYDLTTKITLSSPTGTFLKDEFVAGVTSGATARVVQYNSNTQISVVGVKGSFTTTETLTGNTSAATATVSSITLPEIRSNSGRVLYLENRTSISRSSDQTEDFKVSIRF